jgi:hypothetical protein
MKFRRMREVYWLEASANATRIMENVTPMTDIIEPASVDNIWRAPSAPTPNKRGHWASQRSLQAESASINAVAKTTLPRTISEGKNQKLDRRLLQSCLNLFMGQAFGAAVMCLPHCHRQLRISGMSWLNGFTVLP